MVSQKSSLYLEEYPFKMNITPELIQSLESSFIYKDHKTKKQTPYRVKFNGEFITTKSKKTIWPSIGAAKNALINHFEKTYDWAVYSGKPHYSYLQMLPVEFYTVCYGGADLTQYLPSKFFSSLIVELEKQKIIEYIPV